MDIKHAKGRTDFQKKSKKFVINMMKNSRPTLHIKNGCYYGEALEYFVDFDTYEEAEKSGIDFVKCKNCFK